jgi:CheY-like chemotaxis protein
MNEPDQAGAKDQTMPLVLVVEDNLMNRKLIRDILEIRFTVAEAPTAEDAREMLATLRPVLILMDIHLPGMDGLTLTRLLKADPETRPIPVVAVSAHAMKQDIDAAMAAGCVHYLTKPLVDDPFELVDRLAQFIPPAP